MRIFKKECHLRNTKGLGDRIGGSPQRGVTLWLAFLSDKVISSFTLQELLQAKLNSAIFYLVSGFAEAVLNRVWWVMVGIVRYIHVGAFLRSVGRKNNGSENAKKNHSPFLMLLRLFIDMRPLLSQILIVL